MATKTTGGAVTHTESVVVHTAIDTGYPTVEVSVALEVALIGATGTELHGEGVVAAVTGVTAYGQITQEVLAHITGGTDIVVVTDLSIGAGGAGDAGADGAGPMVIVEVVVPMSGGSSGDGSGSTWDAEATIDGKGSAPAQLNWLLLDELALIDGAGSVAPELLSDGELVSVEEVWNTALTVLGVTVVQTTGEGSPQADLLNAVWDGGFRVMFLADHAWNGAKRTKKLVEFVSSPTGNRWSHAYSLPDDYVRAFRINGKELQPDSHNYGSSGQPGGHDLFEIEVVENADGLLKRCLLTDEGTVMLEYMFDVGNANIDLLSPMTKWAMGVALAAHAAPNFGKSQQDIALLQERANKALMDAKGVDGQEGTPQMFQTTPILDSRY